MIESKQLLADLTSRIARIPDSTARQDLAPQLSHLRDTFAWLNLSRAGRTSPPSVSIVFGMSLGYFAEVVAEVERLTATPLTVPDDAVRA